MIASDIRDSLDRLGIETIDLYYLHRDDPRVPVGEIIDSLNREIAAGHIRHLGASNWPVAGSKRRTSIRRSNSCKAS